MMILRAVLTLLRRGVPVGAALLFLAVFPAVAQAQQAPSATDAASPRALVHILDYMAQDYPEAVADGRVVNADEYAEMEQFSVSATRLLEDLTAAGTLPADANLDALAARLGASVREKAPPDTVAAQARAIRTQVIRHAALQVAPLVWPDLANGQELYAQLCVSCHGAQGAGDGPLAPQLEPRPTNFVVGERIASLSPFQAYNTIYMGVEGTAMSSFRQLSDREVWDLAFFVKSLQPAEALTEEAASHRAGLEALQQAASLEQVATLNDPALAEVLARGGIERPYEAMAALRTTAPEASLGGTLEKAEQRLTDALAAYRQGAVAEARQHAVLAYLEGVEPVEPSLTASDPRLTATLEQHMMAVRGTIEGHKEADVVAASVAQAQATLQQAHDVLTHKPQSAWLAFLMAASILLREGLEAFLIVLAILGVVKAVGDKKAALWVHGGWIVAVLLGVMAWFYTDLLLRFGAAQRELMEGGIALLAVLVLLSVGFWLHSKTEIDKWREFIDVRIKQVLQGGNLFGLATISFFAVFREAFESVLFLSALTLEEGPGSKLAVSLGAVLSIVLVLIVAALLLRFSARLPLRSLFKYSSLVMGVLSVILIGKGIHALQESGLLSITSTPFPLRIQLFGVYPTLETLLAQVLIITLVVLLWNWPKWKTRAVSI